MDNLHSSFRLRILKSRQDGKRNPPFEEMMHSEEKKI